MAQNQGKDGKNVQQDSGKSDQNRNAASSRDQQSQQSGQQGSQQSGQQSSQQGSQQHGGQHASGGTPALDDLGSKKKGESAQDASQAFNQQDAGSKKR